MGQYRFCFRCGSPTELRAIEGRDRDYCVACDRPLYENAKPCVGALVEDAEGRLLLLKRTIQPHAGLWDIPGGFLEADEHPEAGIVREVREETGLEVVPGPVAGILHDVYAPDGNLASGHFSLVIYYQARPVGGALAVNDEASEARWFTRAELPPIAEVAFESAQAMVRAWGEKG